MIHYILTQDNYNRARSFKGRLVCKNCSEEHVIGDYVKGNRNSGTSKLYHRDCYDRLFIDL